MIKPNQVQTEWNNTYWTNRILTIFVIFKMFDYSRTSLSRLPYISNISISWRRSSVPWTFVGALGKISLFIWNLSISNISLSQTKYLVPRMRFQANFLSLSRTFKMMSIMNFLSSKFSFLNVTKWKNIQRNTITQCYFK